MINELGNSLKEENTHERREEWARHIIENKISLLSLAALLNEEKVIAMRFMWLVGHICDLDPKFVYPSIPYFFSLRGMTKVSDYNRSLAKLFYLSGVPPELDGEAIDEMFKWMLDAKANVSTKAYCLGALYNLSEKYTELKNELALVISDQLGKNSAAFDKKAEQVLNNIRKSMSSEI